MSSLAVDNLRKQLADRFPSAMPKIDAIETRSLLRAPFLWVESKPGEGGLAWLTAWTLKKLSADAYKRPALWIDSQLSAGELFDLVGRLVIVRPTSPQMALASLETAVLGSSFALVAMPMPKAMRQPSLQRLIAVQRCTVATQVVLWGQPPVYLAPPRQAKTSLKAAISALLSPVQHTPLGVACHGPCLPHTTGRLRPLARIADRGSPGERTRQRAG